MAAVCLAGLYELLSHAHNNEQGTVKVFVEKRLRLNDSVLSVIYNMLLMYCSDTNVVTFQNVSE